MTNTKTPGQLLQTCLEQATVFPEHHDQRSWMHFRPSGGTMCGTTGCLAGHAVLLGDENAVLRMSSDLLTSIDSALIDEVVVRDETGTEERYWMSDHAAELLDLSDDDAEYMFAESRTLDELWTRAEQLYPGEVCYPSAERIAEIRAAGPLLVSRVRAARWVDSYNGSSGVVSRDFA